MEAKSPASWMQDPGRLNSLVLEWTYMHIAIIFL
jgi:hypothetical protein